MNDRRQIRRFSSAFSASFLFTSYVFSMVIMSCALALDFANENDDTGPILSHNETLMRNITYTLNMLLQHYNKTFRPNFGKSPVTVNVSIDVRSMGPISEKDMEFSVDCYFRQKWIDERLKFNSSMQNLSLNAVEFLKRIWKPDTHIRNGMDSYLHRLTVPNKLLRLYPNGEVYVSQRLTIKARCPMYLRKFPMDTQACPIEIGSFGYPTSEVIYRWEKVELQDIQLSQYQLDDYVNGEMERMSMHRHNMNFSVLLVHFKLRRQQGYYLLQIYVPCIMVVALSWVSFWINKEASPARVALGVMTVLTMTTLGLGGRNDLPRVSYSTALDMYILSCFGFVFSALVEYAVINYANIIYWRKRQKEAKARQIMAEGMELIASTLSQQQKTQVHDQVEALREAVAFVTMSGHITAEGTGDEETDTIQPGVNQHRLSPNSIRKRRTAAPNLNHQMSTPMLPPAASRSASQKVRGRLRTLREILKEEPHTIVDYIDDVSKVLFPFLYILFNAFYWALFLFWIPDEIEDELIQEYGQL